MRLATVLSVLAFGASANAAGLDDGFSPFWMHFKAAVTSNDVRAVQALTVMPLEVGFEDDQDRPGHVGAAAFSAFFHTEMKCSFSPQAGVDRPEAQNIAREAPEAPHDGLVNFDRYTFKHTRAGWRWALVNFADVSELKARLHGRC